MSDTPWQKIVTAVTILVAIYGAVLSTIVFLDQRREARENLIFSAKPHVDFEINDDPDEPPVGIAIRNAGPGPAVIKTLTFM